MTKALTDLAILVVDDNPQCVRLLMAVLEEIGVQRVHAAGDGIEAQELLDRSSEPVDLIVCDWQMPRMTGLELLQRVRAAHPEIHFMMLTGTKDRDSIETAKNLGVDAFLGKPYTPDELERKLVELADDL